MIVVGQFGFASGTQVPPSRFGQVVLPLDEHRWGLYATLLGGAIASLIAAAGAVTANWLGLVIADLLVEFLSGPLLQ